MVQLLWKGMASHEKIKHQLTIESSNSTSGYVPQRRKAVTQTATCTTMFIGALFTIAKR